MICHHYYSIMSCLKTESSHGSLQLWLFCWTSFCRLLLLLLWLFLIFWELKITGLIAFLVLKLLVHMLILIKVLTKISTISIFCFHFYDPRLPTTTFGFVISFTKTVGSDQRKPGLLARYMKVIVLCIVVFIVWLDVYYYSYILHFLMQFVNPFKG